MISSFPHCALGFGLRWRSEMALPLLTAVEDDSSAADITVRRVSISRARVFRAAPPGALVQQAEDGFRYTAGESVIDASWDGSVEILLARSESGGLPAGLFSTVAALLLAVRGAIPLHGSAVELGGRAVLICGPSGAGKSTLAASLIASGGKLVSDDLSILYPTAARGGPGLFAGRRTMRLFSDVAGFLGEIVPWVGPAFEAAGKLAVMPPQVSAAVPVPLTDVVLLGEATRASHSRTPGDLGDQLFRPRWMRRIPGHDFRTAALYTSARQLRLHTLPHFEARDRNTFLNGAEGVFEILRQA